MVNYFQIYFIDESEVRIKNQRGILDYDFWYGSDTEILHNTICNLCNQTRKRLKWPQGKFLTCKLTTFSED